MHAQTAVAVTDVQARAMLTAAVGLLVAGALTLALTWTSRGGATAAWGVGLAIFDLGAVMVPIAYLMRRIGDVERGVEAKVAAVLAADRQVRQQCSDLTSAVDRVEEAFRRGLKLGLVQAAEGEGKLVSLPQRNSEQAGY